MSVDDLAAVLCGTAAILLDFDGPVADLFPRASTTRIFDDARSPILQAGIAIPEPAASTRDHLVVLQFAATHAPTLLEAVEHNAIDGEVEAAHSAPPTPDAADFLTACKQAGWPVAIVSNNAAAAIEVFLELHGLTDLVAAVVGRPYARPDLMKPNPVAVDRAVAALDAQADNCIMIGDAVTDIEVSRRAGTRSIGYAKTPKRSTELVEAGADAIATTMADLAAAVRRVAGPQD